MLQRDKTLLDLLVGVLQFISASIQLGGFLRALLRFFGQLALAHGQFFGAEAELFLQRLAGLLGLDQGRLALAERLAVVAQFLLYWKNLGGSGLAGVGLFCLLRGLDVQLLGPLVEMNFLLGEFFFELAEPINGRLHTRGAILNLPALLIVMPLFIFPLGPESLHFLDAALHVGFGFLMAIALFENRLFLAAEIVLLFFESGSEAGERGLLRLEVSRPLGGFRRGGINGRFSTFFSSRAWLSISRLVCCSSSKRRSTSAARSWISFCRCSKEAAKRSSRTRSA